MGKGFGKGHCGFSVVPWLFGASLVSGWGWVKDLNLSGCKAFRVQRLGFRVYGLGGRV